MTPQVFSLKEAEDIADNIIGLIRKLGIGRGVVGGGWMRDADNGVAAKDIDVYVEARTDNQDVILAQATSFYKALGHEFEMHRAQKGTQEDRGDGYAMFLTVFQSINLKEGEIPVDLIFTPRGVPHEMEFDFGICCISRGLPWTGGETHRTRSYEMDKANKTITLLRLQDPVQSHLLGDWEVTDANWEGVMRRLKGHAQRLRAKYPEHKFVMEVSNLWSSSFRKAYVELIEEGLFEDPRQVFSAERQIPAWDEVRLEDREAFIRDVVRPNAPVPEPWNPRHFIFDYPADVVRNNWFDLGTPPRAEPEPPAPRPVETRTGRLRGRAQVQPGFADRIAQSRAAFAALAEITGRN